MHSDKKPYECVICGKGFMRKPQLYTHMQQQGHLNDTIIINQPHINENDEGYQIHKEEVKATPDLNNEELVSTSIYNCITFTPIILFITLDIC